MRILGAFYRDENMTKPSGRPVVGEALNRFATEALKAEAGPGLFGDAGPTPAQILSAAIDKAQKRAPEAAADLLTAARRPPPDQVAASAAADAAVKEQPALKPNEALGKVQAQIADIEASMFPERAKAAAEAEPGAEPAEPEHPSDPDLAAAQALVDTAEKRKAGIEQIAACPGVIGA